MAYAWLATLVLLLHGLFVLFVVFGGLAALRRPQAAWLHLPAAGWGALVEFRGWICPLTPLENRLRALAGQAGYDGGFIEHYLLAGLYPHGLTPGMQMALGIAVVALNVMVYAAVLTRRHRATAPVPGRP